MFGAEVDKTRTRAKAKKRRWQRGAIPLAPPRAGLAFSALEGDVDIYTIIFAALAVFIFLRLCSVLGQRTGSKRPFRVSAFTYRLSMIAAVSCALLYVANQPKWYSALKAAVTPVTSISGLARVVDGDTVVVVGILLAMALLLGAALVLSFLHWRDWKAQKMGQGDGLKKAKPLDGLLRDHPSQRKADDPPLPHQPSGSNRWRYPKGPRGPSPNFRSWPAKKPTATMRHEFYLSPEWLNSRARYQAIKAARGACQACGARKSDGVKLVVDHIKPVRHYWHLRFAADNLQVLCEPCNLGKGSWDQTDWRCSPDIRPQRPKIRGSSVSSTTSS